jgi:hypothetical protein
MARMFSPPPAASRQSLEFSLTSLVWCSGHFGTTTVLKTVAQVEQLAAKHATKIKESACLGYISTDSNASNNPLVSSVFTLTWGTCFSLKANPNRTKNIGYWHNSGTAARLLFWFPQSPLPCKNAGRQKGERRFRSQTSQQEGNPHANIPNT